MLEDRQSALELLEEYVAETEAPSVDLIEDLAWTLREDGRVEEAGRLLDRWIEAEDFPAVYHPLLIDRAYVDVALHDHAAARRRIDRLYEFGEPTFHQARRSHLRPCSPLPQERAHL